MAEESEQEENQEESSEQQAAGNRKKKIIIFAAMGLVVIALSVVGTLFMLSSLNEEDTELAEAEAELNQEDESNSSPDAAVAAIYIPVKPPFIVNFQARGRQRFLQLDISLMSRDHEAINAVQIHMPLIRNALVLLFGSQSYEELRFAEGKEALRKDALTEVQKILETEIGRPGIEEVFFTSFVMQ